MLSQTIDPTVAGVDQRRPPVCAPSVDNSRSVAQTLDAHLDKILLIVCLLTYILTAGGHLSSTDEEDLYLNTALLSSRYTGFIDHAFEPGPDVSPGYRAPQEVGQSLLALPWYWVGGAVSRLVHPRWRTYLVRGVMTTFNMFITLLTVWMLYRWACQMTSRRTAIITAGLYSLCTLAWPYSQTFYREPLVGLCLLIGFWFAARFRKSLERAELLISVAALMLAVSTKIAAIIALPWWLFCLVPSQIRTRPHFWRLLCGACLMLAVAGALVVSAKWQTLTYYLQELHFDIRNDVPRFLNYGLRGLLISPGKGLLLTAPPVLLSFLGFSSFVRRYKREGIAIGGVFLTFLLVYSTRRGWHGGACWGPRYLVPVLPLLMLPGIEIVRLAADRSQTPHLFSWVKRSGVALVALLGFLVQLAAVSIFPLNYYLEKDYQGVIHTASLDGGPGYLHEVFFDPAHSPVWGQAAVALERASHLVRYGAVERLGIFPAEPDALREYVTAIETLDFWWLHWLLQSPRAVSPDPRLGLVLAPADRDWLALGREGGALFNRWQIDWRGVEPTPGAFRFEQSDRDLAEILAAGLQPTVILCGPPDWATVPGTSVPRGIDLPIDSEQNRWARFVRAAVSRYPEVIYWEIWNEPDMEIYWGASVEEYFHLLKASYLVIKEVNPNAKVIMGGLAYWSDPSFFERLLDLVLADPQATQHNHYFDISAWHWYGRSNDLYDKVLWARMVMEERHMDKPIWINETNVLLEQEGVRPAEETIWIASPQEQAAFIVQAYANALAAGAEKVFVFRLDDAQMPEKWGLATNERVPRPAYVALQAVAEFLNDATPVERQTRDGVTQVTFLRDDGASIWVMWNETPIAKRLELPTDRSVVRLGYHDRRTHLSVIDDGVLRLVLPPATRNLDGDTEDFFIGGAPVFVLFEPLPTPNPQLPNREGEQ